MRVYHCIRQSVNEVAVFSVSDLTLEQQKLSAIGAYLFNIENEVNILNGDRRTQYQ